MKKIFLTLIVFLLLTGCTNTKDNLKFKEEYEKDNDTLLNITIPEDNYIKYITKEEATNIVNKGTGVIYIGSESNNECRQIINTLINAADSTDLKTINYLKEEDLSFLSEYVENTNIPLVLFVYEGKVKSYKYGTGNSEEELLELYLDGIHEVLNDICDDDCND